jgi:hypothetical protein
MLEYVNMFQCFLAVYPSIPEIPQFNLHLFCRHHLLRQCLLLLPLKLQSPQHLKQ